MFDDVSGAKVLLERGADANLLGTRDAAAVHLAAGAERHSDDYTALLLSHSANPNVSYVSSLLLLSKPGFMGPCPLPTHTSRNISQ